jgi:hypothetical protein
MNSKGLGLGILSFDNSLLGTRDEAQLRSDKLPNKQQALFDFSVTIKLTAKGHMPMIS